MRQASQGTNWSATSDETANGVGSVSWAALAEPCRGRADDVVEGESRPVWGRKPGGVCDRESRWFEMKRYETFHADDRGQGREELQYSATEQ